MSKDQNTAAVDINEEPITVPAIPAAPVMPGSLSGSASIEVHTTQGWKLVYSRKSDGSPSPMTGLLRYAKRAHVIWGAAATNDPFADWYLERMHQSIEAARMDISDIHQQLTSHLKGAKNKCVAVDMAVSSNPVTVPLQFSTPYGFMGAYLISDCDELIRTCYTCRYVGMLASSKCEQNIRNAMRIVLNAFEAQKDYRFNALTRDDAVARNAKWQKAVAEMGNPPSDIVDGRRPKISPMIHDDHSDREEKVQSGLF